MSLSGYFMLVTDLARWLDAAQRQPATKNKVRKDLWTNFMECIHFYVSNEEYHQYVRIPRAHFTSLQTFCMMDGRGQETLSNDQLLNFVTTLDELRQLVSTELALTRERDAVVDVAEEEPEDDDQKQEVRKTPVKTGKVARE